MDLGGEGRSVPVSEPGESGLGLRGKWVLELGLDLVDLRRGKLVEPETRSGMGHARNGGGATIRIGVEPGLRRERGRREEGRKRVVGGERKGGRRG